MPAITFRAHAGYPGRKLAIATFSLLAAIALLAGDAGPAFAAPTQISYIVMPHPDDEYQVWSLTTGAATNYKVFIYMTQGEQTGFCVNNLAAKNGYQGPSSPVGQPNYNEINPLGTGANIWVGQWTSTCKNARRQSTLNFLRDKAASDSSVPSGFTLRSTYSFTGTTSLGYEPQRLDGSTWYVSKKATVYDASNGMGKVIFFDLGDGDLRKDEVSWAISKVRGNKSLLGIPTGLPEHNALGSFRHLDDTHAGCGNYNHNDHKAVHEAMWQYDMISGKQYARTCSKDPDRDPGRTKSVTSTEHEQTRQATTTTRVGPFQRRYGWLAPGYWDVGWDFDQIRAQEQYFWGRFS